MCHRFCHLCIYGVLVDFEQVIVSVLLYLAMSGALVHWGYLAVYSGSMAATLNVSPFKYVYFSLGYCVFTSF